MKVDLKIGSESNFDDEYELVDPKYHILNIYQV